MYPPKLDKIINLFESLPEDERRETLVSYSDAAKKQEPREGEKFDLQDVRKDEECADTVGVYDADTSPPHIRERSPRCSLGSGCVLHSTSCLKELQECAQFRALACSQACMHQRRISPLARSLLDGRVARATWSDGQTFAMRLCVSWVLPQ